MFFFFFSLQRNNFISSFFFSLLHCLFFISKCICLVVLDVYACMYAWCQWRPEEVIGSPLSGVNECCEPPSKCWESKSRLLQKQPLLLTAEPTLLPNFIFLLLIRYGTEVRGVFHFYPPRLGDYGCVPLCCPRPPHFIWKLSPPRTIPKEYRPSWIQQNVSMVRTACLSASYIPHVLTDSTFFH